MKQSLIDINDPRWPIARALLLPEEYYIQDNAVNFIGTLTDINTLITLVNAEYDRIIQDDYERRTKYC